MTTVLAESALTALAPEPGLPQGTAERVGRSPANSAGLLPAF